MKQLEILAVVGMAGSGKSLVCDYLKNKGFCSIYFGGIVLEELSRRKLPKTQAYEKQVREDLRAQYGMGAIALLALPKIEAYKQTKQRVLIDGLYSLSEYLLLKKQYQDGFKMIAIACDKALRYERLANRPHRPLTTSEAASRDLAEIQGIEKAGPIALADYTLLNNTSKEHLIHDVELLMSHKFLL